MLYLLHWVGHAGGWLADNIDRYQTLLAGVLAIIAARIAVKPVWEQVVATNTQTQIAHLETLRKLLSEALQRSAKVEGDFAEPLRQMNWALYDPAGEPQEVDGPTAHNLSMHTRSALAWYLETLAGTESAKVEEAKSVLKSVLDEFERTLSIIEWMDHNDQVGEDYAYTDEEWKQMQADAEIASKEAAAKGDSVFKAFTALQVAQRDAVKHLRAQIRNIEHALAKLA